jgi:CheY-like chemotaxis protein
MAGERILVIDDSPTIVKMVQILLSRAGYAIEVADDGEAGLEAIRRRRPDLVLLDYMMPRMNGYQVCRELAADPELSSVPVVLMSAKGDQVGERFVQMAGVVDYVTKPFPPEALGEIVLRALGKSRPGAMPQGTVDEALDEAEAPGGGDDDLSGNLQVMPLTDVLQLVEHHELSGLLVVHHGGERAGERIELHLRRGRLEQAMAHGLAEELLLGRFALDREPGEREALAAEGEAGAAARGDKRPLFGQRLVERGLLTRDELRAALTRQSSELVYEALRWRTGRFRFRASAELAEAALDAALALPLDQLVREGCRRVDDWHVYERAIGSARAVLARDDGAQRARAVRLSREEQLVLELLDGQRDVGELVRAGRLGSYEVFRSLYRLLSQKLARRVE